MIYFKIENKFGFLPAYSYLCIVKLSVIIPAYMTEATLDRCIGSVASQHVDGLEIILVDDGSPDQCPRICDDWAQRDSRITVIHQPNGGLSSARNAGLDIAKGEYITFVDSDDYIAPDTYRPLLSEIGEADILEYPIAGRLPLAKQTYDSIQDYWLHGKAYLHTYAWNKIYRSGLFRDVRFPVGKVFEDAYTLPLLLKRAHRVATTDSGLYHYYTNPKGITATADGKALTMLLEAHVGNGMPVDNCYYMHLVNIQMDVYEQTGAEPILPQRPIHLSGLRGIQRLKAIMLKLLGIKRLCKINKLIHRIWRSRSSVSF